MGDTISQKHLSSNLSIIRRHRDLHPGIAVLQTAALLLGYAAIIQRKLQSAEYLSDKLNNKKLIHSALFSKAGDEI